MALTREFLEEFLRETKQYLPKGLYSQLRDAARNRGGGRARHRQPMAATSFERVALQGLSREALKALSDNDLQQFSVRLTGLKLSASQKKEPLDLFHAAAQVTVRELKRRGIEPTEKLVELAKQDLPRNEFGLNAGETLALVAQRGTKFTQEESRFVMQAPSAATACGTCRFYLRDPGGSVIGGCEPVEGPIPWFATCAYYISAADEAAAVLRAQVDREGKPAGMDEALKDVCDPASPDYDPSECSRRKARRDGEAAYKAATTVCHGFNHLNHWAQPRLPITIGETTARSIHQVQVEARRQWDGRITFKAEDGSRAVLEHWSDNPLHQYNSDLQRSLFSIVPPAGPVDAPVVFVTACATSLEAARGEPLVGPIGKTFNDLYLTNLGLPRARVHIVPAVPVQGPDHGMDFEQSSLAWKGWRNAHMDKVSGIVIALGRSANEALGLRADYVLPHPAAVHKKGDTGEVGRKMKTIRRALAKRLVNEAARISKVIVQRDGQWCVLTEDQSRTLGCHDTRDEALDQLRAVETKKAVDPDAINASYSDEPPDIPEARDVQIINKDVKKQIVFGVVLTPYQVGDAHDDWAPPADIERAAHAFLAKSRVIGFRHSKRIDAVPVESFVWPYPTPEDRSKAMRNEPHRAYAQKFGNGFVKSGEWIVGTHVRDSTVWAEIMAGNLRSYSIGGFGVRQPTTTDAAPKVQFIEIG